MFFPSLWVWLWLLEQFTWLVALGTRGGPTMQYWVVEKWGLIKSGGQGMVLSGAPIQWLWLQGLHWHLLLTSHQCPQPHTLSNTGPLWPYPGLYNNEVSPVTVLSMSPINRVHHLQLYQLYQFTTFNSISSPFDSFWGLLLCVHKLLA